MLQIDLNKLPFLLLNNKSNFMLKKYLIFGATGSIGFNLAEKLKESENEIHLVARNEDLLKDISKKLECTYTVADVLETNFIEKVKEDISDVSGIAYCIGSIDLKPLSFYTRRL